jgi:hypothetical protein
MRLYYLAYWDFSLFHNLWSSPHLRGGIACGVQASGKRTRLPCPERSFLFPSPAARDLSRNCSGQVSAASPPRVPLPVPP